MLTPIRLVYSMEEPAEPDILDTFLGISGFVFNFKSLILLCF